MFEMKCKKAAKSPLKINFLKPLTLSFNNPEYSSEYDKETKNYTFTFFKIFLYFAIFYSFSLNIKLIIQAQYMHMIRLNIETLGFVFILCLKNYIKNLAKIYLDLLFSGMIVAIYIIHVEFIMMPFFKITDDCFIAFYLGLTLEILRIFLFICKIKWWIFYLSTLITNSFLIHHLLYSHNFMDMLWLPLFPVIIGSYLIPLILTFLKEKNEKEHFCNRKNYEKYFMSYENLIKTMIPDPILILNSKKTEILFCNAASSELFQTQNTNDMLNQLSEIEISQISCKNSDNTSLMNIYDDFIIGGSKFENENFEGVFTKNSCENSALRGSPLLRSSALIGSPTNNSKKKYYFDIKFVKIFWRENKAFLVLLNDTSPLFNYKKMKEITQYKDKILATFSHDLRSPLSGIVGMLEIVRDSRDSSGLDNKTHELLNTALNSAKILKYLVNDIIDFSFISRKQLVLIKKNVKIGEIMNEIYEIIEYQIKEKGLDFIKEIKPETLNTYIHIDSNRLKQILLNLILNAIKYTYKGFIKIQIKVDSQANFIIKDSGIGIPESNLEKIFSLFEKIDNNKDLNSQYRAGLGFGLVISQALAKQVSSFGNGITVRSTEGEGSTFSFAVPLSEEIIEGEIASERIESFERRKYNMEKMFHPSPCNSPKTNKKNIYQSIRILVVDDDMINIMVHSQYLKKFNLKYDSAFNGKEAINKILENSLNRCYYNIILMDCNMPVMDGFQAAEEIQQLVKQKQIPHLEIIAVTANASIKAIDHCKNSGMNHFLEKPVSIDFLKEKLESLLEIPINYT